MHASTTCKCIKSQHTSVWRRELHKEVVAGIDEAMARHAKETDKVDLLTLKQLKARVNVLEQQIVQDKARQLTVRRQLFLLTRSSPAASCLMQQTADWTCCLRCLLEMSAC